MNTRFAGLHLASLRSASLAVALILSSGGTALAQAVAGPAGAAAADAAASSLPASVVGKWIRDPQGNIFGSVRSLTADGRTAEIMVGSYFQNGSHVATVPSSALSVVDGRVVLRTETLMALNAPHR